jgi:hypothetical protein
MMSNSAVRFGLCAFIGLFVLPASSSQAARIFGDTFETGVAGANIGAPWAINSSTALTATYQTASNPFASGPFGGTTYGDLTDASAANSIRMISNLGADNSLSNSLNLQVSTFSFDFYDVTGSATASQGLIAGYYRQQANPDLNGAGRSYGVFLHNGTTTFTGVAAPVAAYTLNTMNTLFMVVNDTTDIVTNYAGSGHDLAPTSEDVWITPAGGSPTYLFSAVKVNTGTPTVGGAGFRTFTGDIEHMQIDNVLVSSGATFDRGSLVAFPSFSINRGNGQLTMSNTSAFPVTVKGYSISSAAGSLVPGSWNSIADHSDSNSGSSFDPSGVWLTSSSVSTQLAESTTGTGGTLAPNVGILNLGNVWARTPYQDLIVSYTLSDGTAGTTPINYTGTALSRSDLNGDGPVTSADWQIFLAGSGANFTGQTRVQSYLQGDLNGDLVNDFADYKLFQADYIAANGPGSFEALLGVPEPSSIVIALVGLAGLGVSRRRRKPLAALLVILCAAVVAQPATAATPVTYKASGDPALAPDANGQVDDAWTTGVASASGTGFFNFPPAINENHWILFSTVTAGVTGSMTADHSFDTPLNPGQAVSLDFGNSNVSAASGGFVGVSLTSAGVPVATFKLNAADAVANGLYRYDDAVGTDQSTGASFAFHSLSSLEFRIDSGSTYTAAFGNTAGTKIWTGTTAGTPIDGIRVFNTMGGNGSDVIFDNLKVGATGIVPLTLEVNKTTGEIKLKGNATLAGSIDFYQITSAGNALNFTSGTGANQWNSLDLQNLSAVDGGDGGTTAGDSLTEGWDKASNASKGRLAEYFVRGTGSPVPVNGALSIGRAYDASAFGANDGDLLFSYAIAGSSKLLTGVVNYITSSLPGDFDHNGVVNGLDLGVWRTAFAASTAAADADGDGDSDGSDFLVWQRNTTAASVGSAIAVPEPGSALLAVLGVGSLLAVRRNRR